MYASTASGNTVFCISLTTQLSGRIYWLYLGDRFLLQSGHEIINCYLLFSACTQTSLLHFHTAQQKQAIPLTAVELYYLARQTQSSWRSQEMVGIMGYL
jgi:hypothetical protein